MIPATKCNDVERLASPLPALRFEIPEASRILRMSRAQLYHRIGEGAIRIQKDGSRSYITMGELKRYVEACDAGHTETYPPASAAIAARSADSR